MFTSTAYSIGQMQMVDYQNQQNQMPATHTTINGDNGNNYVHSEMNSGRDDVDVNTYGGNDVVDLSTGDCDDDVDINTGKGNDRVDVEGGFGSDDIDVFAGNGDDVVNVYGDNEQENPFLDGVMSGNDDINVYAGEGDDEVNVDGGYGDDNVNVYGGDGDDKMNYQVSEGNDNVYLGGGDGHDSANINIGPDDNITILDENGNVLFQQGEGGTVVTVGDDVEKLRVYGEDGKLAYGKGEMSLKEMLESGQLQFPGLGGLLGGLGNTPDDGGGVIINNKIPGDDPSEPYGGCFPKEIYGDEHLPDNGGGVIINNKVPGDDPSEPYGGCFPKEIYGNEHLDYFA